MKLSGLTGKYVNWQGCQITVLVWENTSTVMEQAVWTEPDRAQEVLGHFQAQGGTLAVSYAEPGVGLMDPDGFFPT